MLPGRASPAFRAGKLCAQVIHVDGFGNLITNVTKEDFLRFTRGKRWRARIGNKAFARIYSAYATAKSNELFFIAGSFGFLEVSRKNAAASGVLGAKDAAGAEIIVTTSSTNYHE